MYKTINYAISNRIGIYTANIFTKLRSPIVTPLSSILWAKAILLCHLIFSISPFLAMNSLQHIRKGFNTYDRITMHMNARLQNKNTIMRKLSIVNNLYPVIWEYILTCKNFPQKNCILNHCRYFRIYGIVS